MKFNLLLLLHHFAVPVSDTAPQQKHRALRAMGALNLLRDSHRVFAIHMKEPSVPRTGRSNCARSRLTKYQPGQPQRRRRSGASASHISGEPMRESFSGIPAGRHRNSEGPMPGESALYDRPMSCKIGQHIWAGCLRVAARLALEGVMRSLCRSLCLRAPPRCASTEAEGIAGAAAKRETKQSRRAFP